MSYSLQTSYMGESLLSGFNWFNGEDLSNGFVSYQSREDAEALNLYSVDEQTQVVRLGVDHTNTVGLDEGRPSIRIESKESYNHGLFIADFLHMPPSQCGLWPAFWMYGNDWPHGGELDIIEGANTYHRNIISAHTADGCQQDDEILFTGEQRNTDCAIGSQNIGCGFNPPANDTTSYGDSFNAVGGGVYAVEWDSDYMKVWHFSRGFIPSDIESKMPDPSGWGAPQAVFGGSKCDVDSYFKNMSIVININFCGDYGEATWGQSETCSSIAPTCAGYVANNPEAFANAHWDINYIDAYQLTTDNIKGQFITPSPTPSRVAAAPAGASPIAFSPAPASPVAASPVAATPAAAAPAGAAPEAEPAAPRNPHTIDTYINLGCFASDSDFSSFKMVEETKQMTLDRCVQSCSAAGHSHAGVFGLQCLCADGLDVASDRAVADDARCSKPCPANDDQSCGGGDLNSRLLAVYASIHKETQAPLAAAMGGGPSTTTITICPTPNAANRLIEPPSATPGSNITYIKPYIPAETPTAGSAGLLPDWKLGALSSVVVIGALMLL